MLTPAKGKRHEQVAGAAGKSALSGAVLLVDLAANGPRPGVACCALPRHPRPIRSTVDVMHTRQERPVESRGCAWKQVRSTVDVISAQSRGRDLNRKAG